MSKKPPGWRFFSSPAFPETRSFFFLVHKKTPVLGSLFDNVAGLKFCNFIKKSLQRKSFSVNIPKFLRTAFSIEHSRWLFLLLLLLTPRNFRNVIMAYQQLGLLWVKLQKVPAREQTWSLQSFIKRNLMDWTYQTVKLEK